MMPDIGQEFQIELEGQGLAGFTGLGESGGAVGGGFEAGVALAAAAAGGEHEDFARHDKIFDQLAGLGIFYQGSRGNFDNDVFAVFAALLFSLARDHRCAAEMRLVSETAEGCAYGGRPSG